MSDIKRSLFYRFLTVFSLLLILGLAFAPVPALAAGPAPAPDGALPDLNTFAGQVSQGSAAQVAGLYAEGHFAYPVVQQPAGQPAFVSSTAEVVTQFRLAADYGSLGFLAHNTLAGVEFFGVGRGDLVAVVYGDGRFDMYRVTEVRRFQALQPRSPYSSFVDLATNQTLSAQDLFHQTYGVGGRIVLQTCITAQGDDSWGRLFIIAEPLPPEPRSKHTR